MIQLTYPAHSVEGYTALLQRCAETGDLNAALALTRPEAKELFHSLAWSTRRRRYLRGRLRVNVSFEAVGRKSMTRNRQCCLQATEHERFSGPSWIVVPGHLYVPSAHRAIYVAGRNSPLCGKPNRQELLTQKRIAMREHSFYSYLMFGTKRYTSQGVLDLFAAKPFIPAEPGLELRRRNIPQLGLKMGTCPKWGRKEQCKRLRQRMMYTKYKSWRDAVTQPGPDYASLLLAHTPTLMLYNMTDLLAGLPCSGAYGRKGIAPRISGVTVHATGDIQHTNPNNENDVMRFPRYLFANCSL